MPNINPCAINKREPGVKQFIGIDFPAPRSVDSKIYPRFTPQKSDKSLFGVNPLEKWKWNFCLEVGGQPQHVAPVVQLTLIR